MVKEDRRVRRTKNMLQDALVSLIIEKGYEAISIQDIADRADVGRSTFYFHFLDKEQLLQWSVNQLRANLEQRKHMEAGHLHSENGRFGISLAMLQHVKEHKELYQATMGKQSGVIVMHYIRIMVKDLIGAEMGSTRAASASIPIPENLAVEFVVSTFMTILTWWMEEDLACTVQEADRLFHHLISS